MAITTEDVKMVAQLSRLNFSDKELEQMQTDMGAILDYMKDLRSVDTSAISTNYTSFAKTREDKVGDSIPRSELLKNAPKTDGASFVVPQVVD